MTGDHWSTQLLTEFTEMVLSYDNVSTAYRRGIERIAEGLEAEVAALVGRDHVVHTVGFPRDAEPLGTLVEIARARPSVSELPGLGESVIEVVPFDPQAGTMLVVGRLDGVPFGTAEVSLLRGMARILLLGTRMLGTLERLSQAMFDPLTGLADRRLFVERLARALERADASGVKTALLYCDVDRFKGINDSLGHSTGDTVLTVVAERVRSSMRDSDIAARLGGDEFAILLEDIGDTSQALAIAGRVVTKMASPVAVGDHQVPVGISIGVVLRVAGEEGPDELLRNADLAMYQAKAAGRGVTLYEPWMYQQLMERVKLGAG